MNPSLLLIPDRYKASKLYSQIPDSGAGDLAFTRANDTATRVNSAGLIEKVRTNLVTYSEDFANAAWTKNSATVTSNTQANPINGELTADTITATGSVGYISSAAFAMAAVPYTISMYAKKSNVDWVSIEASDGIANSSKSWYNISNGTLGTTGGTYTILNRTITNAGNGWYRLTLTFAVTAATNYFFVPFFVASDGALSVSGNAGFGFGAQAETSDFGATPYIPTTTAAVSVGPVANIPRIDYTGGGCGKLLLEPQRTNLIVQSERLNTTWTDFGTGTSVTPNVAIAPDGTLSADLVNFAFQPSGQQQVLAQNLTLTAGVPHTISFYAKAVSGTIANLVVRINGGEVPLGQTITTEWQRFTKTITPPNASDDSGFKNRPDVSGNGAAIAVYLWGVQIEAGAYPTSYIPTLGASVTRSADAASKTGISSLIGQTSGTLYIDVNLDARAQFTYFTLSPNLTVGTNYLGILIGSASIAFESVVGSALQAGITLSNSATGRFKIAAGYNTNDFVLYVNGSQVGTDTSGSVPACSEIGLYEFAQVPSLKYNTAALYTTRLSNSELASLTTL